MAASLALSVANASTSIFTDLMDNSGGDLIEITLAATATPENSNLLGTSANAIADPYFQIDPTFAAANPDVSLIFRPGIENVPLTATPEPSDFLVTGAAMVGMILVYRRRSIMAKR
jgi:hypothetical protein